MSNQPDVDLPTEEARKERRRLAAIRIGNWVPWLVAFAVIAAASWGARAHLQHLQSAAALDAINSIRDLEGPRAVVDHNGQVLEWSPSLQRLLGWSQDEMLGESIDEIIPDEMRNRHRGAFARQMNTARASGKSTTHYVDCDCLHKNGERVWMRLRVRVNAEQDHHPVVIATFDPLDTLADLSPVTREELRSFVDYPWLQDKERIEKTLQEILDRLESLESRIPG